jgi:hypothetical protein
MYYTDQRGGIGQTFTGMLYFHYDNFGNTAMLTDASGVPQVLYQYDLRTGLFTSINANNIRNPFTSLGEEGAITDSLTLTTNVDWMVYKGGVDVSNMVISILEKHSGCSDEKDSPYIGRPFSTIDCDCWSGSFSDKDKEDIAQDLREDGLTKRQIKKALKKYEDDITDCCENEQEVGNYKGKGMYAQINIGNENGKKGEVGSIFCQLKQIVIWDTHGNLVAETWIGYLVPIKI